MAAELTTKLLNLDATIRQIGYAAALRQIAGMMRLDAEEHRSDAESDRETDEDSADQSVQNADDLDGFVWELETIADSFEEWHAS